MAKVQSGSEDRAKVKFRVFEFELEGGNASVENSIRQLAQVLSPRTSPVLQKTLAARPARELDILDASGQEAGELIEPELIEPEDNNNGTAKAPKTKASRGNKLRVPQYIHDLGMTGSGSVTFKDFAAAKRPKNNNQRHLVAAFWLKDYGGSPTITPDKVYTCYRNVGWPTSMNDWDGNFRQQIQNNRFRRVNPGEYAINPRGEDEVRTMDGTE